MCNLQLPLQPAGNLQSCSQPSFILSCKELKCDVTFFPWLDSPKNDCKQDFTRFTLFQIYFFLKKNVFMAYLVMENELFTKGES